MEDRGLNSFASNMIKLSVSETKWSSLLARTGAFILYISIWIFDFRPEKLPGLSRNGPQAPWRSRDCRVIAKTHANRKRYLLYKGASSSRVKLFVVLSHKIIWDCFINKQSQFNYRGFQRFLSSRAAGCFNVGRLKSLVPRVQFSSQK